MSNKPNYKTARKYKCPYCDVKLIRGELIDHVGKNHEDLIPEGYTAARAIYDSINGKNYGICMACKKPVYEWNDKINRYYNLCKSEKCRSKVREIALERHMKVYNKPTLLNDPEQQEKMLANRRISGTYIYSDGKKFVYTGKYERNALEFMDKVLNIPSQDIQTPGPVLEYEYNGKIHKWITDIYYIPANLLIEIKDGGNNPNTRTMSSYRDKQVAKEVMITDRGTYNYIRLTNNDFAQLLDIFADMKNGALNNDHKARIHINESTQNNCIKIPLKDKEDIKRIYNSFDEMDRHYYGTDKLDLDNDILFYNIEYVDNVPAGFILIIERIKNKPFGLVSIGVDKEFRNRGIAKKLLNDTMSRMKKDRLFNVLTYNVIHGNDKSAKIAQDIGFKFYKTQNDFYDEYYYDFGGFLNEEVGGLPPHRPPVAYVIPYGMNNVFDGFGYTDSELDGIVISNDDGEITTMSESDFYNTYKTGPVLCYSNSNIREKIVDVHKLINKEKLEDKFDIVSELSGFKLLQPSDIILSENFKYYDTEREAIICKLIENGVIIKVVDSNSDIIRTDGNVVIHLSPNGYYATTPSDFYIASDYFENIESLERSNIISVMNDIYSSNSSMKGAVENE